MEYDGEERRSNRGWHLKKEISLGHLLTTATIAIAGIGYVLQNEKSHATHAARLDALQSIVIELKASDIRQDGKLDSAVARIEAQVNRLGDKMDRLIEQGNGNGRWSK